jgi:hypothetical protein
MLVKVQPLKLTSESLSAHDDQARNPGGRSWGQDATRERVVAHTGVNREVSRCN